jgi:hypothetical protein
MLSVSLNCPFVIAPSVFSNGNVIFMGIHIYNNDRITLHRNKNYNPDDNSTAKGNNQKKNRYSKT